MENKQKRKLISAIYKTIILFSVLALGLTIYLEIDKLNTKANSVLWLDICILCVVFFMLVYIIGDASTTRNLKNKYRLGQFLFFIIFNTIVALVVLAVYYYYRPNIVSNYTSYILPISLVFGCELISIINFLLGLSLSKLYKNTSITLDSMADTPNFNDELLLKKRLDELNRKLEMKKIQDQIDNAEKKLDE